MQIPSQFTDVDFRRDPNYVFGSLALSLADRELFGDFRERFTALSNREIEQAAEREEAAGGGLDLLVSRIYNQGREGSCVANATCQAHELCQAIQYGIDNVVHLSAISLYKRIGRSPSSGATVASGLRELQKRGALPLDNPENRQRFGEQVMPNTGFSRRYPRDWETTAAKFRGVEAWEIRNQAELETALVLKMPVVVGRQGHSICYVRRLPGGKVKYVNSWGNWGDGGFGYDTTRQVRQASDWAFCLRTVTPHELRAAA